MCPLTPVLFCSSVLLLPPEGIDRGKIWLGLNFYGQDFDQQTSRAHALMGDGYLDILAQKQPKAIK